MSRKTNSQKGKESGATQTQRLKDTIEKTEEETKTKKNEYIRVLTDAEVEYNFLTSKMTRQTEIDKEELQLLNDRIRQYKSGIMRLKEDLSQLEIAFASESFASLKTQEATLLSEIEKLKKEKNEKEKTKLNNKKLLSKADKIYEQVETEKNKYGSDVQTVKQTVERLENLKTALEIKS
ncbi:hypothetical protein EIN_489990 [Entamoeba invadens IP1]|uniref:Uncharacterized protein n=1 Tax=Entamoeba invadens IP1 TaxID=370355 RepID=A0A0A1U441_ENTIV|nr:hypothetical protein EIN_489990 [Entamoeba invadens IP1]ELP88940.1 hypothetical protein EIN_489990 [Entamoeba invadens IP1]|eukprot:XP_004255711.1 hypothetical protein EIN_489990 [Entamoeba invadens IP1]